MIQELINDAKARGLNVYGPEDLTTYFYFTDGEKIGYCQADRACGPSWSTVHKPNTTTGTGFAAKSFDEALSFAPAWASGGDRSTVQKFTNWDQFAKKHWQPLTQY
jgi:hypothetical protein